MTSTTSRTLTVRRVAPGAGLALACILLLAANMRLGVTSVGPLVGQLRADLGLGSAGLSALVSLPLLCFAAASPLAPRAAARWGLERALALATVLLIAGLVVRSVPGSVCLWAGTVFIGVGIAFINVLLPSFLKRDFPTRIGPLSGLYNAAQSACAAAGAAVVVPLSALPGWSWRTALAVLAVPAVVCLVTMLPLVRRPPDATVLARTPAVVDAPAAEATVDVVAPRVRTRPRSLWVQFDAWQVALFMGLQSCLYYSVLMWWPDLEAAHGVSAEVAGVHLAIMQVVAIAGSLGTGSLLRRLGPAMVTATVLVISLVGLVGQLLAPSLAVVWVCALGIGLGGNIVSALAMFGARTVDHRRAADLSGMAQSFGYLLAAALPVLVGALHDATGGWRVPLLVLIGVTGAALVFGVLGSRDRLVE